MGVRTLRSYGHRYYCVLGVFLVLLAAPQVAEASDECEDIRNDTCSPLLDHEEPCLLNVSSQTCPCFFSQETSVEQSSCQSFFEQLGYCCGEESDPVLYFAESCSQIVQGSICGCALSHACSCLNRNTDSIALEELCFQICVNDTQVLESVSGKRAPCQSALGHVCRRNDRDQILQCAQSCVRDKFCHVLIEGILEDDFVEEDINATLSILQEFLTTGTSPLNVTDMLLVLGQLYEDVMRQEETVLNILGFDMRKMLMFVLDDLLIAEREEQFNYMDLEVQDEVSALEIFEHIETTVMLFGKSHLNTSDKFIFSGNNMAMTVECTGPITRYSHHIQRDNESTASAAFSLTLDSQVTSECGTSISSVLYSNIAQFIDTTADNNTGVNTDVLTIDAVNAENGVTTASNVEIILSSLNTNFKNNATCVVWNVDQREWSTYGMKMGGQNDTHYICYSSHLSSFAVLGSVTPIETSTTTEAFALSIVSYIGCSISIVFLLLTLFWLVALRKKLNKGVLLYIHLNLSLSLLLALILFVGGIETATSIEWLCTAVAAVSHYLFLCVFCWMLAEGIMLYLLVVRVFGNVARKWYYLLPVGWGLPIPIVAVSIGIRHNYYGTENYCWISAQKGTIWAFIGPMSAVILVNAVILVMTVLSIVKGRKKAGLMVEGRVLTLVKTTLKSTVILLPLLGVTWIVGIFAVSKNTTVFAWLFTILNSLQGMLIFLFHVVRNKQVLDHIKKIIFCKRCNKNGSEHSTQMDSMQSSVNMKNTELTDLPNDHNHHSVHAVN